MWGGGKFGGCIRLWVYPTRFIIRPKVLVHKTRELVFGLMLCYVCMNVYK